MSVSSAVISAKKQILSALSRWQGNVPAAEQPLFRRFVEDTLNRLRGPFLAQHSPSEVLHLLEQAFEFAKSREKDAIKVAIHPGASKGSVVLSSMTDQAFIVDTIRLFLKRKDAEYWGGFNLVFHAKRNESGYLVDVGEEDGQPESLVLLEADIGELLGDADGAARELSANLEFARAMVTDFGPMTRTVERFVERFEALADRQPDRAEAWNETSAFLKWLLRENFVFMGIESGTELGIQSLKGPFYGNIDGDWPTAHSPGTVQVRKSRTESPVHRSGRIDEILVSIPEGESVRTLFIRGMFTYRAVTQPSRNVPILRTVLGTILDQQQSRPGSFRYKGIANVFDSLPTEFLFTASLQSIAELVDLVWESEQQQDAGVTFLMTGPDSAFCLIAMPKTEYSDELRREVEQQIIATSKATYSDHGLFVGRYETVLLHYYLTGVAYPGAKGVEQLTATIRHLATPWLAKIWHAIAQKYDETIAERLTDTYGRAFPEAWVRRTPVDRALRDIELLESLSGAKNLVADLYAAKDGVTLNLYQSKDVYLTDILPVLDNFGLVVRDSETIAVQPRGGKLFLDSFHLEAAKGVGQEVDILSRRDRLVAAIEAVFSNQVEADRLNQLVISADLSWQEVDVIRGLMRYLRQLNVKLAVVRMREILLAHPVMVRNLVALFHARFNPAKDDQVRSQEIATTTEQIRDALRQIRAHDEDLLFSSLLGLITAAIRTNFYRTDRATHYLSFKFDCCDIKEMGSRRPLYEVYVHHKDVEGVHLRFGKVARGGIRWSDRDDYRTEVLDLVSTQQVKNVVIVPEGAKGGFYLKHPSRDAKVRRQEADFHYQTFIRGLLDLTDNSVKGTLTRPPNVVCHDPGDPYLVVAADKGTAHLSDTANALSKEYGHWLGDAFASGGSVGYDHKKVGITARGAWVLVRRHFAELGINPYKESFSCVGIGDMSGDVFGNGLIESPFTRLLAAFNHVHIFLDPNPDPKVSFEERSRLFKAERNGGWENYNPSLISEGGGLFDRTAKAIRLSLKAQEMLGLHQEEAEPDLVIRHILRMKVDLLWNGGIGTYVKASSETHTDAGDRSNDGLRVDGAELGARIVGEGGNLGFTQKGRIEAALSGVRINTDAIDNSGGVDLSDHEVNLKILLDRVVARGDMTGPERDELLRRMTDEVATLVMNDNDAHGRQLSRDQVRSKQDIFQFGRAIAFIEQTMGQPRSALNLPNDKELSRRAESGIGLTRPELSVLSAWVKMYIYRELLRGSPKDLPGYDYFLVNYFPKELQERFPEDIQNHMLANEIAMTVATTRLVADAGATLVPMLFETLGSSVSSIATAYFRAQLLARTQDLRPIVEQLPLGSALNVSYQAWIDVDAGVRDVAAGWLARGKTPSREALPAMAEAVDHVYSLQPSDVTHRLRERHDELKAQGLPGDAIEQILKSKFLGVALVVHAEAERSGGSVTEMIVRHLAVARASLLQDVLDDLEKRPATGRWDPIALRILHHRFANLLRLFVVRTPIKGKLPSVDELSASLAEGSLAEVRAKVAELIGGEPQPSIPALIVLEEHLSSAIARLADTHRS